MGTRVPTGAGAGTAVLSDTDANVPLEIDELPSLADDFVGSLYGTKYDEAFVQTGEHARILPSTSRFDLNNVEQELKGCQEQICSCKEMIQKIKAETIPAGELEALESKMEEKLQEAQQLRQDFRAVRDELDALERQRVSKEERIAAIRKKKKALHKAQKTLSMYVSVTKIVPKLDEEDKIAGYIIDKNKKKIETFEFENTSSPVEICNELWKMI